MPPMANSKPMVPAVTSTSRTRKTTSTAPMAQGQIGQRSSNGDREQQRAVTQVAKPFGDLFPQPLSWLGDRDRAGGADSKKRGEGDDETGGVGKECRRRSESLGQRSAQSWTGDLGC